MTTELALYEHAREAIAAAVNFDEVTKIRSDAERAKAYARIAKDRKLAADAQEIIARAERKLGILLRKVKESGQLSQGGRPSERSNLVFGGSGPGQPQEPETSSDGEPVFDQTPFTLAELGISKKLSMRAQQLADLDEGTFENSITATREKILSADAAVVNAPKIIKVKPAPVVDPVKPLAEEQWHRFAFAVLALTMASDRVSSGAIHLLAENRGILALDGDTVDFTPEAMKAMGPLAEVALRALDGEDRVAPVTENEAPKAVGDGGEVSTDLPSEPVGTTLPGGSPADPLDEGHQPPTVPSSLMQEYRRQLALVWLELGSLTMAKAEPAMRAGYAAEVPIKALAQDLGHPLGTVKTWANRLELTSIDRMHARQHRFGGAA